jgi:hypothetical protein
MRWFLYFFFMKHKNPIGFILFYFDYVFKVFSLLLKIF